MASTLSIRPQTSSTGGSGARQPSVHSFQRSASHTTLPDDQRTSPSLQRHQQQLTGYGFPSSTSQPPNGRTPRIHRPGAGLPQRPVKSQYPPYAPEKHVEYILVASFDIDRGSVMEHQYPGPVGGDEHMLAELMLPDQTHMRSQDWTIFFLHKDAASDEEKEEARMLWRQQRREWRREQAGDRDPRADDQDDEEDDADDSSDEETQVDGPPLVYVLNLVNTKQDNTVKRGAIVKAMAICTRHSFLHIYKPLLLLALEQYFATPGMDTLASLYEAVNSMDLSLLPKLNGFERHILQCSETKDLFLEKFESIIAQRMALSSGANGSGSSLAQTPHTPSRSRYGLPRDTHEFETVVKYGSVPVPIKVPTALTPETVGDFSLIKLITTFSTPHTSSPQPFNPTHPHLTTSGTLTHPIIVLLNALLTQKRVIFIGHNLPSSDVAEAVLAACSLASGGLLRGFTRHAFPYTDLTKVDDLLKVPGFIAGVTNPAFAHKSEWWDLLCDLPTGRMKISTKLEQPAPSEGSVFFQQPNNIANMTSNAGGLITFTAAGGSLSVGLGGNHSSSSSVDATGDSSFMAGVLTAIHDRRGENAVRAKFRRWVLNFTRLAAAFEETVFGASALQIQASPKLPNSTDSPGFEVFGNHDIPPEAAGHGYVWPSTVMKAAELAANANRIEGWRNTRSYYNFIQDLATFYVQRPVKALDLQHLHDKLAKLRLSHEQSAQIYLAMCTAVDTDDEISELLSVIASGVWVSGPTDIRASGTNPQEGLFYIALGLFHQKSEVREAVADLLERIRDHGAGRHFFSSAGRFSRLALERVKQVRDQRKTGHDSLSP